MRPSGSPRPQISLGRENVIESFTFSISDMADHFRSRVSKATCAKYRACTQKLSAVFKGGPSIRPRHILARPPEPGVTPIAKAI